MQLIQVFDAVIEQYKCYRLQLAAFKSGIPLLSYGTMKSCHFEWVELRKLQTIPLITKNPHTLVKFQFVAKVPYWNRDLRWFENGN